ncbi:MAG: ABC transporter ATP-binding protein [Bacilli bacterium]|nr:ABC transporter ATP-binding protein [Bacilli bacterium]
MANPDFKDQEVIVNVEHLTKDYGFGRGVFDVSIQVHKGECYGYLGPNGAGKSTTIRHIMGFSKSSTGKVEIFGQPSFGNSDKILGRVGYLPGEPAIPQGLNGWGFIKMMQGMRGEANEEYLQYLLKKFAFDPSPDVKEMSLGDKRKLAVVTAFMNDPDVLILDEPTSGLDPVMQKVFIDFIVDEKKRGKTILLSSHIFSEVDATCDTISIIKDGKHVSTFNAKDVKNAPDAIFVLRFRNKENLEKYLANTKYEVIDKAMHSGLAVVKFPKTEYKEFLHGLIGYKLNSMEERSFSLQDYFMSFYKEQKEFGGLGGVVGNGTQPKEKAEEKKPKSEGRKNATAAFWVIYGIVVLALAVFGTVFHSLVIFQADAAIAAPGIIYWLFKLIDWGEARMPKKKKRKGAK